MKYDLHKFGTGGKVFRSFSSRRSFCAYMRKMDIPAVEIADGYFLHVVGPRSNVIYDLVAFGSDMAHLRAVPYKVL